MASYLYNGVELPALPESIKAYAMIYTNMERTKYYLVDSNEPFCIFVKDDVSLILVPTSAEVDLYIPYSTTAWISGIIELAPAPDEKADTHHSIENAYWVWSNADIYDDSGSMIYAASEPALPGAYDVTATESDTEIPEFCQTSFKIGLAVGLGLHGISSIIKESIVLDYLRAVFDPTTATLSMGENSDHTYEVLLTEQLPTITYMNECLTVEG